MKIHFYNNRKQKLSGILNKKYEKGIILSHGFASRKESLSIFNEFLSKKYSTLAFDYSGHGESEGLISETSVARWANDLGSAIDFMEQHCDHIALFGFSLGGMASLICSSRAKATIAIAPPTNFRKLIAHFIKTGLVKELKDFVDFGGLNIDHKFITDSIKYDTKKVMKDVKCPILIIHGDKDDIVPLSQSEEAMKYVNNPKKLVVVGGFAHGSASEEHMSVICEEISEWLEKYL